MQSVRNKSTRERQLFVRTKKVLDCRPVRGYFKNRMNMASEIEMQSPLAVDSEKLLESAIESNLQMTYENRIEAHENARQFLIDLRQAGEGSRAKSQRTS